MGILMASKESVQITEEINRNIHRDSALFLSVFAAVEMEKKFAVDVGF